MSAETALTRPAENKLTPFREALAKAQGHFQMALPITVAKYLTPERLTKITLSALSRNPTLMQCTPESVLRSVMDAASLGLEPAGGVLGHAYLVPYRNTKINRMEAQLIVGYRGLIDLARRSGKIQSVEAHVVYERDQFDLEYGRDPKLAHKPSFSKDRGEIKGAYCVAQFVDGTKHCEFMTRAEIDGIRTRSRARDSGPWVTDFAEMCRKTVVRRAAKYWPLSSELVQALEIEDAAELGTIAPVTELAFTGDALELEAANSNGQDSASKSKTRSIAEKIKASESKAKDDEPPPPEADYGPPPMAQGLELTEEQLAREREFHAKHGKAEPGSDG